MSRLWRPCDARLNCTVTRWNRSCALALTSAARLTPAERVALARRVRSLTPANIEQTDSTDLIRQDRDSR